MAKKKQDETKEERRARLLGRKKVAPPHDKHAEKGGTGADDDSKSESESDADNDNGENDGSSE